jgi:GntR family transcriptional regulator / MocR family aminotransferase
MTLSISLESSADTPVHRQIYEAWQRGILSGRFASGARLPSTRELAATLSVSRGTVTQAYEQLLSEGYLQAARGSGTYVCRELPERTLRADAGARRGVKTTRGVKLSTYGEGLRQDYPLYPALPGHVCFAQWGPDRESFPWALWRRIVGRHSRRVSRELFDYSEEVQGHAGLREEIAAYVARSRAVHCTPGQVIIINGSQQALDLCGRLLFERGDTVAVENPGYPGALRTFASCGALLQPMPIDKEGILCRHLNDAARAVYVTPSHQYPTGVSMSLNRRLELIAWARKRSAVIIEDDYDSEYRYSGAPLPALQGLAEEVPVVYCGTFSKVMFPGLRIGYLIVPESLVAPFTRAKRLADNYTPLLQQIALRDFLAQGHLERHIRRMRRLYGDRRDALLTALRKHFGDAATVEGEDAGMHAFVRIADRGLLERAKRNKVQVRGAQPCYLEGDASQRYLFGFSSMPPREIREGIRRLAR